ncbi:MAG: tRNA preQ1(34) S-adenosylmethionine ribosyltransferase-isomerase QueA [Bdellovibrionota bacterium]|nr:tRNA preQ1(34) S-adenosylmethionine ribosyltransferase-isomerase QueA [Bdellovibrionota bacterium]
MHLSDFDYQYPEELIALEPQENSRVLLNNGLENQEISLESLIELFAPGDVLVLNDTKVVKKRLFAKHQTQNTEKEMEVLFLEPVAERQWQVLFPVSRVKDSHKLLLPEGIEIKIIQRGKPQIVELSKEIDLTYFAKHGELPLPPYIQKARGSRHEKKEDESWYQTAWAEKEGSAAAPTASLHFKEKHLRALKEHGVEILKLTLHVGLGTFLPVSTENLEEHIMHKEWIEIPKSTLEKINQAKEQGNKVWALGTTVTRSLESYANQLLEEKKYSYVGASDLFIYPPYEYKLVDVLLTNFHQPKTTLMALVAAFTDIENLKKAYSWAIENRFRLFSYGDLSVWMKK